MAEVFYPGQKDYIKKLNDLAELVSGMASGTAGPKLITRQIVTAPGMTLYTLPFAVAGWPDSRPVLTVGGVRTVNYSLPTARSIDISETIFAGEAVYITALAL